MNRSASLHAILIVSALTILPPILFGIWFVIREKRKAAALEASAPSFSAQDTAAPSFRSKAGAFFFRCFDVSQRAYLRRQHFVLAGGLLLTWIFFVYFSSGLMSQYVSAYAAQQPLPLRVWYSYLFHISNGAATYGIFTFGAAGLAVGELGPASAIGRFLRTRPLSRSFLFWIRVGSVLSTVIFSLVLAAGASFILLLMLYGPVWKHLNNGTQPTAAFIANARSQPGPSVDDILESSRFGAGHFAWALQTSIPRLFLSIITTQSFFFSLVILLAMLPIRSGRKKVTFVAVSVYVFFMLYIIYIVVGSGVSPDLARICFFYVRPGPPPPYIFALVPIVGSAALLGLASNFSNRNDG
jgi:hypothetical protein